MVEKVVFEFRADQNESGCEFEFGHSANDWFGPTILACCQAMGVAGMSCTGEPMRSHHHKDRARHHMRETLDFLEQVYDDLFGGEESASTK